MSSLSGKREVCKELRKRITDACCLHEVRWRGQGLVCWGWREEDISCGSVEKEMELVV